MCCATLSQCFYWSRLTQYQLSPSSRPRCPQYEVPAVGCKTNLAEAKILKSALSLVLNNTKVILNDQGVPKSNSFEINLDLFRAFRYPLFLKQITGRELLFGSTVHTTSSSTLHFKYHMRILTVILFV